MKEKLEKLLSAVVLAGIYVYLGYNLFQFVFYNNLLRGDAPGHLFLVSKTANQLLPWGVGWVADVWGGFVAGHHYPPLFYQITGALATITTPVIAVKIVVSVAWLAIPALLWMWGRKLFERRTAALAFLLGTFGACNLPSLLLGTNQALGTNLESTIGNGMFPSLLGFVFFILLAILLHSFKTREYNWFLAIVAGLFLGLVVLTHVVWGVAAILLVVADSIDFALRQKQILKPAIRLVVTGIVALFTSGYYVIPMLWHSGDLHPVYIGAKGGMPFWVLFLLFGVLSVYSVVKGRAREYGLFYLILFLIFVIGVWGKLPFHWFRLELPLFFVGVVVGLILVSPVLVAESVVGLIVVLLSLGFQQVNPRGNPFMKPPLLSGYHRSDGVILVAADEYHQPGYMALSYLTTLAGGRVSHGISVESATNGLYYMSLVKGVAKSAFTWGVSQKRLAELGRKHLAQRLICAGVSHVLTDVRLEKVIDPRFITNEVEATYFPNYFENSENLSEKYNYSKANRLFIFKLYEVSHQFARVIQKSKRVGESEYNDFVFHWFQEGCNGPVPILDADLPEDKECSLGTTSARFASPAGDELVVRTANSNCPVWVKVTYDSHWRAVSPSGKEVHIARGGLNQIVVWGARTILLKWQPGECDYIGRGLTLIVISLLLLLGLGYGVRRWRQKSTSK